MRLFGLDITRAKAASNMALVTTLPRFGGFTGIFSSGLIREAFSGAWQRGVTYSTNDVLTQSTVWSCITLIMSDIGKLGVNLIERQPGDIWVPTENSAYSPVLRKPNHFQIRIKFFESWVASKLTSGNTYVLKARDNRRVVQKLFVLDPSRVHPLVAPSGDVFYQLGTDNLAGIRVADTVPASEIIHDVGVAPFHPLCGLPPIVACYLAANHSLSIQNGSLKLFSNGSQPGGILTAPNKISEETAKRIKDHWDANYSGEENIGKVAVLGDGLEYKPMSQSAVDSQLAEQLKWTDEKICATFHVPGFMVGVGPMPTYDNIEKLNQQYYQQALQNLIECIELCLDEGLGLSLDTGIEFDLDGLIRMDSVTKMKNATEGVKGGVWAPDEARRKFNLPKVDGGATPYLQQQNYSLGALAKRDAKADPFAREASTVPAQAAPEVNHEAEQERALAAQLRFKTFARQRAA